jgi:septal ring factor EnvC (AmiA/AmiB activator)
MANTEIRNALKSVREAEDAVTEALDQSGLTQSQRNFLNDLLDFLRDMDNHLVVIDLGKSLDELVAMSKKLDKLNKDTQRKLDELKKVAKKVDTAAVMIGALAKAFGILGEAGLL